MGSALSKTIKILTVCSAGLGTCTLLRMKVEEVLREAKVKYIAEASDIGTIADGYDVIVTMNSFVPEAQKQLSSLRNKSVKIIGISDVVSSEEMKKKLTDAGVLQG